jgi:hypothetical protein
MAAISRGEPPRARRFARRSSGQRLPDEQGGADLAASLDQPLDRAGSPRRRASALTWSTLARGFGQTDEFDQSRTVWLHRELHRDPVCVSETTGGGRARARRGTAGRPRPNPRAGRAPGRPPPAGAGGELRVGRPWRRSVRSTLVLDRGSRREAAPTDGLVCDGAAHSTSPFGGLGEDSRSLRRRSRRGPHRPVCLGRSCSHGRTCYRLRSELGSGSWLQRIALAFVPGLPRR